MKKTPYMQILFVILYVMTVHNFEDASASVKTKKHDSSHSSYNLKHKKNTNSGNCDDVPSFPKTFFAPTCGWSDATQDRVVGGEESQVGSWPWIALVGFSYASDKHKDRFFCGGTLISSRHVISAAHCVEKNMTNAIVRLGEQDMSSDNDTAKPIDVPIRSALAHPKYNRTTKQYDIAIFTLAEDVKFTDRIRPICLPIADDIRNRNLTGTYPFVAGWGATHYGGPRSTVLLETQVPVVNNSQCSAVFSPKNVIVDEKNLCAGYEQGGKDACQGDSGGPLMSPYNESYYLIGVVSTGFQCAVAGYPGLYTRTSAFLKFIHENVVSS